MGSYVVSPEAETIKSLLNVSGILALIFGILWIVVGIFIFIFGAFLIIFGIVDIVLSINVKSITVLVDQRKYKEAKDKTLVWMIVGFIFGGIIIGILLLIAYLKYDELIRREGSAPSPPPPP